MSVGFDHELKFLAFDHRGVFFRSLFESERDPSPKQIAAAIDAKHLIYEALLAARSQRPEDSGFGILVDDWLGSETIGDALAAGLVVAVPVEEADRSVFQFAHGDDFAKPLEALRPTFAKVLVRYNVEASAAENDLQATRLQRLSAWLESQEMKLLFELIVEPTSEQLSRVGGEVDRFQREHRPALIRAAIADLYSRGIEVDVWKLEGVDEPVDAEAIVAQARAGSGRDRVVCTVLGAGAPIERVEDWLRVAGDVDGFCGFAIGRSIWRDPVATYLADPRGREAAVSEISSRYLRLVDVFSEASHT